VYSHLHLCQGCNPCWVVGLAQAPCGMVLCACLLVWWCVFTPMLGHACVQQHALHSNVLVFVPVAKCLRALGCVGTCVATCPAHVALETRLWLMPNCCSSVAAGQAVCMLCMYCLCHDHVTRAACIHSSSGPNSCCLSINQRVPFLDTCSPWVQHRPRMWCERCMGGKQHAHGFVCTCVVA
jgi:hypothetical protein